MVAESPEDEYMTTILPPHLCCRFVVVHTERQREVCIKTNTSIESDITCNRAFEKSTHNHAYGNQWSEGI